MRVLLALALAALCAAPCRAIGEGDEEDAEPSMQTAGGLVLFYDTTGPMSFVTMTPKDVPPGSKELGVVFGRACQRGLSVPIAANLNATNVSGVYGNGGYAKALAAIKKEHPSLTGIYDVKTDLEVFSLLGLYKSTCTLVTARGFSAPGEPAP